MKLFLHWLRWDIRRFGSILGVWTLLVLGYATFLGWLHLNILSITPKGLEWSQPLGIGLGVVQVFLLLHLFSTDPAVGTDCFWKTRPPRGIAVAGAKLVIALGFFLALPMLAWLVMNRLCVPPEAVTNGWRDRSWTQFLWWSQAFPIGALSLAAASVAHGWQIPLRVAVGFALAMTPIALLHLVLNPEYLDVVPPLVDTTFKIFTEPFTVELILGGGIAMFLLARWNGAWTKVSGVVGIMLPAVLLALRPIPPEKQRKPLNVPEFNNPTAGAGIRIEGFVLRNGLPTYYNPGPLGLDGIVKNSGYNMMLRATGFSGSSGGIPVGAGWRTLRLTAPDGSVLEGNHSAMRSSTVRRERSEIYQGTAYLPVTSAIFETSGAMAFSRIPCRAEGVLRVMLNRTEAADFPLRRNRYMLTPLARYILPDIAFDASRWNLGLSWLTMNGGEITKTSLTNYSTGEEWRATLEQRQGNTGFLLQGHASIGSLHLHPASEDWRGLREAKKRREDLRVEDWTLKVEWQRPDGYVDIPVVLEPFILPRQQADNRTLADLIRTVPWTEGASQEQARQGLLTVIMFANEIILHAEEEATLHQTLEEKLKLLQPEHLPMLLESARSQLGSPYKKGAFFNLDRPLKLRIAALLQPSDIDSLKSDTTLFDLLRPELIEAGHILAEVPRPKSPDAMSDQELEGWDRVDLSSPLLMPMIEEAFRRGLPWSLEAIMEIVQSDSQIMAKDSNFNFLSSVSDAPSGSHRAKAWLRLHGHKLIWDATLRKWVIPLIRGPGP